MKAILTSIKPKWVAKILNGEKTIEIRKRFPKDYVGWVYIYCTKKYDECLWYKKNSQRYVLNYGKPTNDYLNGKVVARFWCDKVEEIKLNLAARFFTKSMNEEELLKQSCLASKELENYLFSNICCGYAIHITKLEIFDKPKEISEYFKWTDKKIEWYTGLPKCKVMRSLTRAPESYCYVEADQ